MTKPTLDTDVASINQAYGELTARVHDAAYTLERGFGNLEQLIKGDDWRSVGGGFDDINEFMRSVKLDGFRLVADQRKSIASRIKELQPNASNRSIAKALGSSDMTIGRDLAATNVGPDRKNTNKKQDGGITGATKVAPVSGWQVGKMVRRRDAQNERIAAAADRLNFVAGEGTIECRHGDFQEVLADLRDVDAVITDPPYEKDFLPRFRDLAILADRILKPDGVMAVLCGKEFLPEVCSLLQGYRPYRWTACFYAPGASNLHYGANVVSQWKPLLIYGGRQRRFFDIVQSRLADAQVGQHRHKWGQDMEAFKAIIQRLTEPGDTIVDPCAGGGTTLLAAKAMGRNAIGAEIDATCEVFELDQLTRYKDIQTGKSHLAS